jgi:hypothetical protein
VADGASDTGFRRAAAAGFLTVPAGTTVSA